MESGSLGGGVSRLEKVSIEMTFKSRKSLRFANAETQGVLDRGVGNLRSGKHEIKMVGYVAD